MCTNRRPARRSARGFTLIEMIIAIVVIGVGLAGVLLVLNQTTAHSADPMIIKQANAVAESFVAEIMSKEFSSASPAVGAGSQAGRINFASVDDYNGYPTDLPSGGIYRQAAAPADSSISGLEKYRVQISVAVTTSATGPGGEVPAGQMKRVLVTVTDPAGNNYVLESYKANY